jgi:hypothetical protein
LLEEDIGDIWDSGVVSTDQTVNIIYIRKELKSRQRYYWKVKVWDKNSHPSAWSEIAYWEMGLFDENDWYGAQWIGAPPSIANADPSPVPLFRRKVILIIKFKKIYSIQHAFTSNREWCVITNPIVFDGIRNGEFYDARLERPR